MKRYWKFGVLSFIVVALLSYQAPTKVSISKQKEQKSIEVKGEVLHPGVYELPWNASVADALAAAGGISEQADLSALNQTKDLANGTVLIIPKQREMTCISINTATIDELDTLPGIGVKMAQRIIEEREKAPFESIEDLTRVKGIGDKKLAKMKELLCL